MTRSTSVWRTPDGPLPTPGVGPLTGLRLGIKDLYAIAGQRIGAGNPTVLAEARIEPESTPVVSVLIEAGAEPVGINQLDEFAYALTGANVHYGIPPNPAAPDRVSGGSSSASASAVAMGECDIALGADTAGSIRVPAAYQGLYGLRTTHGVISSAGMHPLAPSLDAVGWITRDALTLARVAQVVLPAKQARSLDHVAVSAGLIGTADYEITDAVWRFIDDRMLGLPRREIDHDLPLEHWRTQMAILQGYEAWQLHGAWITAHPGVLGPEVADRFRIASTVTDQQYAEARTEVLAARTAIRALVGDDVLVMPAAATAPPRRDTPGAYAATRIATLNLSCLASIAGLPAVTVPVQTADGLPTGVCLVGAPGTDLELVALATVL